MVEWVAAGTKFQALIQSHGSYVRTYFPLCTYCTYGYRSGSDGLPDRSQCFPCQPPTWSPVEAAAAPGHDAGPRDRGLLTTCSTFRGRSLVCGELSLIWKGNCNRCISAISDPLGAQRFFQVRNPSPISSRFLTPTKLTSLANLANLFNFWCILSSHPPTAWQRLATTSAKFSLTFCHPRRHGLS